MRSNQIIDRKQLSLEKISNGKRNQSVGSITTPSFWNTCGFYEPYGKNNKILKFQLPKHSNKNQVTGKLFSPENFSCNSLHEKVFKQ